MPKQKVDSTIYKQLSADMRDGLKNIYQQISNASNTACDKDSKGTEALFNEATDQLDEVVKTTESAAMSIMEIVEKHLDLAQECAALIEKLKNNNGEGVELQKLTTANNELVRDLTTVLTTLSFQDITGQRIKKVMSALNAIEKSVLELYLSSGLVMEGAEKNPARDAHDIKQDAQKAMQDFMENRNVASELKGPSKNGVSQGAIDDMLSQLGL